MDKKIVFMVSIFVVIFMFTSAPSSSYVNANIGAELKDDDAFSKKANYENPGKYRIYSTYSKHKSAFSNAISKITKISGANIKLKATSSSENIFMGSVNSSSLDYYGICYFTQSYSQILMNEATTKSDNFTQSNYNKVALHELGHAFGMVHQASSVASVMKQGKYSFNDYTSLDKNNLSYKY